MSSSIAVARVILDTPLPQLDHIFEYSIPEAFRQIDLTGYLVKVPLRSGKRFAQGYVVDVVDSASFTGKLSSLDSVISTRPVLLKPTYELAEKVAQRQAGVISDVLRLVIPQRYVKAEKNFIVPKFVEFPKEKSPNDRSPFQSQRQAAMYPSVYSSSGQQQWITDFTVTAIENIQHGKSTILCVPDFRNIAALTHSLEQAGYEDYVVRLDSKISGQERYVNYLRTIQPTPVIIIGNRSAVLSPAHNLHSLLVWDESDPNMTEQHAPYFFVKDVALIRQQQEDISLVFASYSRSVFVQRLVSLGWLEELQFTPIKSPRIIASDSMVDSETYSERIPSVALLTAKKAVEKGPVLFQVASPGYTGALACSACKEKALCSACTGTLYLPHKQSIPQCRQCLRLAPTWSCGHCQNEKLRYLQSGSEKTAEDIGKMFPGIQIIVSDGHHEVTEVKNQPSIVIATPGAEPETPSGYGAVILLDGHRQLLRDISDAEDQYLRHCAQAIALCAHNGDVVVVGSGKVFGDIIAFHRYREWAQQEFIERSSLGLPPSVRVASLEGNSHVISRALKDLSPLTTKSFGPIHTTSGRSKATIFFEYRYGDDIATALKALIITSASKSRKPSTTPQPRMVEFRVKMDNQWLG